VVGRVIEDREAFSDVEMGGNWKTIVSEGRLTAWHGTDTGSWDSDGRFR